MTPEQLAAMIDHTALKPETTQQQIEQLCREALDYKFCSVCVNSVYVPLAEQILSGSAVKVCTVVGFPLGASATAAKIDETRWAVGEGAREIDMVLWVGGVKAGRYADVERDVAAVAQACGETGALLKVILECALLTDDEKRKVCELCVRAGAHYVKTSTGFGPGGATAEDVRLMSDVVKAFGLGVKAAGGIRTHADAMRMAEAGATRIGASASVKIIEEARAAQ
jgi:deoxyribose-phosphate aldolase